jgi:hypothetical protein
MKKATILLLGAAIAACMTAVHAQTTVNFQWLSSEDGDVPVYTGAGVPGFGSGKFWNTVPGPAAWNPGTFASTNSLADDGKTDTGIILTLDTAGSMSSKPKAGSLTLLDAYADAYDTDAQTFTFSKVPNGNYNLVLFGANGSYRGNNITTYTVNGQSQSLTNKFTDAAFVPNVTYVAFKGLAVTNGVLKGTWAAAGGGNHPEGNLNGTQLQRVASKPANP